MPDQHEHLWRLQHGQVDTTVTAALPLQAPLRHAVTPVTAYQPGTVTYYCGGCDAWVDLEHPCNHVHRCDCCGVLHFIGVPA